MKVTALGSALALRPFVDDMRDKLGKKDVRGRRVRPPFLRPFLLFPRHRPRKSNP
jgi:hypothetical protein